MFGPTLWYSISYFDGTGHSEQLAGSLLLFDLLLQGIDRGAQLLRHELRYLVRKKSLRLTKLA